MSATTHPICSVARTGLPALATLVIGACGPLEPCAATPDLLAVNGESGIDGPVSVLIDESDGVVTLEVTPGSGSSTASPRFTLVGAELDDLVGAVTAEAGDVFAGEGSEFGYLRLVDERGVWFEGGRSGFIDSSPQGGTRIDAPFAAGAETGERCRRPDGTDVKLHEIVAQLSDASEAVVLDDNGSDGTWRGVDIRAVGVEASFRVYDEPPNTADGMGAGRHEITNVFAYLYRRRG